MNSPRTSHWAAPGDAPRVGKPQQAEVVAVDSSDRYRVDKASRTSEPLANSPVANSRPRSVLEIIDLGVRAIWFNARLSFGVAAVVVLPMLVFVTFTTRYIGGETVGYTSSSFVESMRLFFIADDAGDWMINSALFALRSFSQLCLGAAFGYIVSIWWSGSDTTSKEVLQRVWSRIGTIVVAALIAGVLKAVSMMCYGIGLSLTVPLMALLGPTLGATDLGPWKSVSRASALASRKLVSVATMCLMVGILHELVGLSTGAITSYALAFFDFDFLYLGAAYFFVGLVGVVMSLLVASTSALMYHDLLVRTTGIDVSRNVEIYFRENEA